jgi:hypothetical protein
MGAVPPQAGRGYPLFLKIFSFNVEMGRYLMVKRGKHWAQGGDKRGKDWAQG